MIHITFTKPETTEWCSWRDECAREQHSLNALALSGEAWTVKERVYKGTRHKIKANVFMNPSGPFHGKCVYCEVNLTRGQHGDMEHYRPKKGVCDAENRPVTVVVDGKEMKHPGYYWLAYSWRNLLPSCILCNKQPSEDNPFGKGNRFPVSGDYAIREGEEQDEKALLLNPVVDDPDEHLDLNELGILVWKTDRGEACVNILGLNERDLPDTRREKYHTGRDSYGALLRALAIDPKGEEVQRLNRKVLSILEGKHEYSMAGRKGIANAKRGVALAP